MNLDGGEKNYNIIFTTLLMIQMMHTIIKS